MVRTNKFDKQNWPRQKKADQIQPRHKQLQTNLSKTNKSGYRGVYLIASGKFIAQIQCAGKQKYLGVFDTAEKAAKRVAIEALCPPVHECAGSAEDLVQVHV